MRRLALLLAAGAAAAVVLAPPVRAHGGAVTLGPTVRVTTAGTSPCQGESEPEVVRTAAGTWVGYNDSHDCLLPVLIEGTHVTGLQLIPAGGGAPRPVTLTPFADGDYFLGDPALSPDPNGAGVILASLYVHKSGGMTAEVLRVSPSLKVTRLPSPALRAGDQNSDDKEFVTADLGKRSRYRGRVYLVWDDGTGLRTVLRAFDGRKWLPAVKVKDYAGRADVAVAPNGDVAVVYEADSGVYARVSTDGGRTLGPQREVVKAGQPGRTDPACAALFPVVGTRQRAIRSVHATYDAAGRLHVVSAVGPLTDVNVPNPGVATGGESTVVHGVSADGKTFTTAPLHESDATRFHPAIAATPGGGVAVLWLELSDVAGTSYDAYLAVADRGSAHFGTPVRLSANAAVFPSATEANGNAPCYGIGDYVGLAPTSRGVVAAWPTTDGTTRPGADSDVLVREAFTK